MKLNTKILIFSNRKTNNLRRTKPCIAIPIFFLACHTQSTVPTVCSKVSWNAHYGCIYYWFCRISGHMDIPANLKAGYRQSSVTGFRISGVTGNRISVESGNGSSGFFPYPEKMLLKKNYLFTGTTFTISCIVLHNRQLNISVFP